jgi:hypothetical protein
MPVAPIRRVLRAIVEISLKPSIELRQLAKEALSKSLDPDPLLVFSSNCRADLGTTCAEQSCNLPTQSVGGHRGIKTFPSSPRAPARSLPHRMISGADHAAVPNRHFPPFSRRSAAPLLAIGGDLGVCIHPSDGGPMVRIHLPPAASHVRT